MQYLCSAAFYPVIHKVLNCEEQFYWFCFFFFLSDKKFHSKQLILYGACQQCVHVFKLVLYIIYTNTKYENQWINLDINFSQQEETF